MIFEELGELLFPKPRNHCADGRTWGANHNNCMGFYGGSHCSCPCHEDARFIVDTMKMPEVPK